MIEINVKDLNLEQILLYAGMIILNIISAYTTQIGYASSVNDSSDFFMSTFVPWGIAIVLSIFLIVFSLQIMKDGLKKVPIIGYLFVAIVSIFFNFNAIYTVSSSDTNQFEYNNKIIQNFNTLATFSINKLENKITGLNIELSQLKEIAEYERNRLNGGEGPIYRRKLGNYRLKKAEYQPKIDKFNRSINKIRLLKSKVSNISETFQGKEKELKVRELFSELDGYTKTLHIHNSKNYMGSMGEDEFDRGSLEYSLSVLKKTFSNIIQGKKSTADTYRIFYAMFFGALIDLLMFFVLIFNANSKRRKTPWNS